MTEIDLDSVIDRLLEGERELSLVDSCLLRPVALSIFLPFSLLFLWHLWSIRWIYGGAWDRSRRLEWMTMQWALMLVHGLGHAGRGARYHGLTPFHHSHSDCLNMTALALLLIRKIDS